MFLLQSLMYVAGSVHQYHFGSQRWWDSSRFSSLGCTRNLWCGMLEYISIVSNLVLSSTSSSSWLLAFGCNGINIFANYVPSRIMTSEGTDSTKLFDSVWLHLLLMMSSCLNLCHFGAWLKCNFCRLLLIRYVILKLV